MIIFRNSESRNELTHLAKKKHFIVVRLIVSG